MEHVYDIVIIGGGAAGMTAAISALETDPRQRVIIIEKKRELGRKILATGNGRCNLSNVRCARHRETLDFFSRLGILTRTDGDGRIYPYTEDAADVRDALAEKAAALGAEFFCGLETEAAAAPESGGEFLIRCGKAPEKGARGKNGKIKKNVERRPAGTETFRARRLILACGGKAGPKLGTTGSGAVLARSLGHTVTRLAPALTAVEVRDADETLAGVRAGAEVALKYRGRELFRERGEIQFTQYGVSGICVFDLSRYMVIPEGKTLKNGFDDYRIEIDFLPDVSDAEALLEERRAAGAGPDALLRSIVKRPLAERILARTGGRIPETAAELKHFTLCPKGLKGWDFAQVTKGGVSLAEIDMDTMESFVIPGLFFAGEIIDYDGPCGGYNLQNAWETGLRAGRAAGGGRTETGAEHK